MEYSKLRGRIVEKFGSQKRFSAKIGLSEQSVTAKLNDRTDFSKEDILLWSKTLDIEQDNIGAYFFEDKLSKC